MVDHPVLGDGRITLRPVIVPDDLATLLDVLRDATVSRWWGTYDLARVTAEYADPEDEVVYLVDVEGETAGMVQYGEEEDPDYRHASIDIALKEGFQGTGVGPAAIGLVLRYLFEVRGHHRAIIDPAVANVNAIRAYEKVGFRPVGTMRQYERDADGAWHDNLLMDLLADDFRAAG